MGRQRAIRWIGISIASVMVVIVVLIAGALWFIGSESGLRWAVAEATARTAGKLRLQEATGSLLGTVRVESLVYADDHARLVADHVAFTWSPRALWKRSIVVDELAASHIALELKPSGKASDPPASLALPIAVDIRKARVEKIDIASGINHWQVSGLSFRYSGDSQRHALDDLSLVTQWGALTGAVSVAAAKPFVTEGHLALAGSSLLFGAASTVSISGDFTTLAVGVDATAADLGASAKGSLRVSPFEPAWLRQATLAFEGLNLARFDEKLPQTSLAGSVDAASEDAGRIRGRLSLRNAAVGPWSSQRLPIATLTATFTAAGDEISLADLTGELAGSGRIQGSVSVAAGRARWNVAMRDVDLRALANDLRPTSLAGAVTGRARFDTPEVEADVSGNLRQSDVALAFDAALRRDVVDVRSFKAQARGGSLQGSATYALKGTQAFSLSANASRLDPSAFGKYPQASLSATIEAHGAIKPAWSAALAFKLADGSRLRGLPLQGQGSVAVAPGRVSAANIALSVGKNDLKLSGDFGRVGDLLALVVDARDLHAIDARLAGNLRMAGRVGGVWTQPSVSLTASGASLRFGEAYAAGSIDASGELGAGATLAQRPLSLHLAGSDVRLDTAVLRRAAVTVAGTLAQHEATLNAVGGVGGSAAGKNDFDVTARMAGGWVGDAATGAWVGKILALDGRGPYAVTLTEPAQLEAGPQRVHLALVHGTFAGGRFAIEDVRWEAGRLSSKGDFSALPAAPWLALAGADKKVSSTLILSGRWSLVASPRINGSISISRDAGDIAAFDAPDLTLGLSRLDVLADIVDDRVHATLAARSAFADADLTADIGSSGLATGGLAKSAPLTLSARVDARSLKAVQALAGTTAVVDGRLALALSGSGTLGNVRLTGSIDGDGLKIEAPQYGLFLKDGTLHARLAEDAITVSELSFNGGAGHFSASGTLPAALDGDGAGSRLAWRADKLALFDRPDTRLILSGAGTLSIQRKAVTLAGSITADQGYFEFRPTPPDTLSSDVVVVGRQRKSPEVARQRVPFDVDLELDFGNHFTFVGEGFDSGLAGKVRIKTTASHELAGFGSISTVNGIYAAFGQRLAIERGRLYFDGPLDNPGLDVVALRKNLPVEAGVAVTGTVRVPLVQLTSNPPVADNEKLSWLVLGHGLDSANSADTAALQAALAAIGGTGGAPIGQRIARTFGVDDISFHSADPTRAGTTGGQVVALSKRLTDKLSLVYEQGLSLANNALKIEYALSRTVTIRASAGVISGFGIYYSRSFD